MLKMPGEFQAIRFSPALPLLSRSVYLAKFADNSPNKTDWGVESSNPFCSTPQSLGIRTSRRIPRNPRPCARFPIMHGPGERPRRPEFAESSETYPGAIWLGPWIIAVNSPADRTRRTGRTRRSAPCSNPRPAGAQGGDRSAWVSNRPRCGLSLA
jgi:hypothetical protein